MHNTDFTDFIALDTETGGLDSAECALLSIAAVPSWDAPPFSVHILPVGRIDAKAAEVNGYTPELWAERGAITPKNALFEFLIWLESRRLEHKHFEMAAHNAGFDLLFMSAIQSRTGIALELPGIWHCTKRSSCRSTARQGMATGPRAASSMTSAPSQASGSRNRDPPHTMPCRMHAAARTG